MSALAAFSASPPLIAVARVLGRFDRSTLEAFMTVAVELLDVADGDVDLEENADREASDGDDQDAAAIEWQTMRASQKRGPMILAGQEDDEDDDPDSSVEDGPRGFDPEQDCGAEEQGEEEDYDIGGFSDPEARAEHRERIRATRCDRTAYWGRYTGRQHVEYRLKEPPTPSY